MSPARAGSEKITEVLERGVGPVLQATPLARAIIAAIEEENEQVFTDDAGAYIRVFCPGVCRVSREVVEDYLGRPVRFPGDLEVIMSSFAGKAQLTEDWAMWWLAHEGEPTPMAGDTRGRD